MTIDQGRMINFAMMIEKHMIDPDEWDYCGAPDELLIPTKSESDAGYPTGIAHHPKYGWFGLGSGQGPFIWWSEINDEEFKKLVNDYHFGRITG